VDVDVAAEVPIRTPGGLDMALRLSGRFHLTDPTDVILGARRPRDNPAWPTEMLADHYAAPSD
jgi:hypothetical protein